MFISRLLEHVAGTGGMDSKGLNVIILKHIVLDFGMPPKRMSTSETPAITLDTIRQLTADFTAAGSTDCLALARRAVGLYSLVLNKLNQYSLEADVLRKINVTFATGTLTALCLVLVNAYAQPME
ncbi:hypothetical protein Tco_1351288 [Tanacetum coccineum]